MGLRVTPKQFFAKAYNTLKPSAKVLAKQVCGDKAKKNMKGKSNACNNAVVAVETQEDGPLEEEKRAFDAASSNAGRCFVNHWQC
jgi:hypothetical protein